ncbi:zinc transport system substrate-binding protein [Actinopolymorpha singaporensis]|uniref:Zinc transport system substrate-binding protein n=2 Tax=Actinopolymorpha singaporensis TaxID=117157 RepID=A0A1H1UF63_9ACTN|nr:zinc transport system substrate-binding protein [Actinopolymorpha singaporensis]
MVLMFSTIRRAASVRRFAAVAFAGLCAGSLLTACGSESGSGSGDGDRLSVVAAFYPLQYAAERVAGDAANVVNLTKPGAEPHDLELSPRAVGTVSEADLVVYLRGLQPAVDSAVHQEAGDHSLDVTGSARLTLPAPSAGESGHAGHDNHDNNVEGGEEADSVASGKDPHFWLDPLRLAAVGDAIAERLAAADPGRAASFRANADRLRTDLTTLDREFRTGLAPCRNHALVTSHAAFGYLAHRYGLTQFGITGLSPDQEPSPAELSSAATFARKHDVRTIYHETLVSPAVAKTVARETGADNAVLDPLEGLTSQSAGKDYIAVMRANLATLRKGQDCS